MPLSPFERIRLDKAAVDEGFGIRRADDGDDGPFLAPLPGTFQQELSTETSRNFPARTADARGTRVLAIC